MIATDEMNVWMKRFGENLLSLIPKGMSVRGFSMKCGLSPNTMAGYISGKVCPTAWTVIKIARALGRPVTDVIDFFY